MKGRYKGEALLTAREVSLWFLTSGTGAWAPLVGLSLLQRPEAPEAGWVLPTLVSASQVSDTADFAVVSIILQEQGICGGQACGGCTEGACVKRPVLMCCTAASTFLPSSDLSHRNEDLLEM